MKKLKNKETGEIGELQITEKHYAVVVGNGTASCNAKLYCSLDKLNAEWEDWEDYEEPKEYWFIEEDGDVINMTYLEDDKFDQKRRQIGNYFETKEEAEQTVKKLKAWKRLKDNGMRTYSFKREKRGIDLDYYTLTILAPRDKDSLDLLFGGEE